MKAMVTGASSGIGEAIYHHLLGERLYHTIGVSRRGPDISMDMNFVHGKPLLAKAPFDVLVINHGMLSFQEYVDVDELAAVNLRSYWQILHLAETEGLLNDGASVILNASVSGVRGEPDISWYAALKGGVINLTKSFAKSLISRKIRVNCFSCGFFKTNLVEGETPQHLVDAIPLGREAEAHEILPVVEMLIDCEYITGQNIIVDGGLTL